ncbi:MAG: hypothetical protein FJ265_16955 [Planctomycetes bacterium]|nr:hypothetical protein [Planctomycetota bacterium]
MPSIRSSLLLLATLVPAVSSAAQVDGDRSAPSSEHRVLLRYASFDPRLTVPEVPATLRSAIDTNLWIVQFPGPATDADRDAVRGSGGTIVIFLPNDGYVVRMSQATATAVAALRNVRWVGPYEPAYRLEGFLLQEHLSGARIPARKYNLVMADKRKQKDALAARIQAVGGTVVDRHEGSLLFTAELTGAQLLQVARFDEVLFVDRWTTLGQDMNNARIQGGANAIEAAAGYTGTGVRGHVYEGVEATHPDFTTPITNVLSSGAPDTHGHCVAGIVFGNGTSHPNARGMAPAAVGFSTNFTTVTPGWSRHGVIAEVVNTHNCMFTTASWGNALTTAYTSISAQTDDIVFVHRIPWFQSMGDTSSLNSRPEAWAKNVITVSSIRHFDNSDPSDDSGVSGGSGGPAQDGRLKPDLVGYGDLVWVSDRTGAAGYASGNHYGNFAGTSAGNGIVAGHGALAIQMYTDGIFNNPLPAAPTVANRFTNRPLAQTLKALQLASSRLYTPTPTDNRRERVGWGFPDLANLYDRRERFFIVPEDAPITQGATHSYLVSVMTGETSLRVCMSYVDPAGNPAAAIARINDLTLRVIHPNGTTAYWGNVGLSGAAQTNVSATGGAANTLDTVECVLVDNPAAGLWRIEITAPTIAQDAHPATAAIDATYALVVNGGRQQFGSGCARYIPDTSPTGTINTIPFGTSGPSTLSTVFASNNNGAVGGAIYFDLNPTSNTYLTGLEVNTNATAGTALHLDVYRRSGTYAGNEGSSAGWTAMTAGHGTAAGVDLGSPIDFDTPIPLSAGLTYGFAIVARNFRHHYTNGNGSNENYNNADLAVACGSATNVPFTGLVFSPRVANMTFQYRRDDSTWTNQLYQTILRREDLGAAGTIHGLAFSAGSTGRHWNRDLRVRMSHVPAGHTMSTTFATNLPTPITVLNASNYTWHVTANTWTEIGLQTPFVYNGTSDVVVEVYALANHNTANAGFHRGGEQRLYAYGWLFGAPPATGTLGNAASRMRVNFNCAVGTEFGTSCGPLAATHVGTPNRGAFAHYSLANAPAAAPAIIGLGFAPINGGLSLTSYGFTNCYQWHDLPTTLFMLTSGSGTATHSISIPNSATYDGLKIYGQWFVLDGTQPGGLTVSNHIANMIGIDP